MIDPRVPRGPEYRNNYIRPLLRWGTAAAVVVAAHGIAVWMAVTWESAKADFGGGPVVMIDLENIPAAPSAPPKEAEPGPEMTQTEPEPEPPPAPEPDVKMPELPQQQNEDSVVAQLPKPPEEKKPEPPKKHEIQKKPADRKKQRNPKTTAPTSLENRADRAASQNAAPPGNPQAKYDWQRDVLATIRRNTRMPSGASAGTVRVTFTLNRSGQVMSVRMLASSGDSTLDQEAVALVHRSSPFPPAPPEVRESVVAFSVPVRFSLR